MQDLRLHITTLDELGEGGDDDRLSIDLEVTAKSATSVRESEAIGAQ